MYFLDHISNYKYNFDAIQVRLRHQNFDDGKWVMTSEYLKIALEGKGKKMDKPYPSSN